MRFLTILLLTASVHSLAEDDKYPLDFFSGWGTALSFPTNFVVTSDKERAEYLSEPGHIHSNVDIRLIRTEYLSEDGESLFAFFDPKNDSEFFFILHVHPEDSDKYDFLMTKNKEEGIWEKAPEDIFPHGNLKTFTTYLSEKTGLFIVYDGFDSGVVR